MIFLGFSLARCSKGYGPVDLTFTVYVNLQTKSTPNADTLYTDNWIGFYYYTDTLQHKLLSYEDALAGKLTSLNGETTVDGLMAEVFDTTRVQFRNMTGNAVLLWIVQPDSMVYAWRQLDLVDGLDSMETRLFFRTWRPNDYLENRWNIVLKEEQDEDTGEEDPGEEDPGEEEEDPGEEEVVID